MGADPFKGLFYFHPKPENGPFLITGLDPKKVLFYCVLLFLIG
jgi:hypothetical protein